MQTVFNLIVLAIVIGSAIWVFLDARKIRMSSPGGWLAGTLFLWLLVFPTYLFLRGKHLKQQAAMKNV